MTAPDTLAAARAYVARGWAVVPIAAREKGPRAPGWQTLRFELADLPQRFGRGGNIGLILGPPSGELVDVDLDCSEALALADIYLPPTGAEFGRTSKRRSHRLYIAQGAIKEAFSDPLTGETLIELRAAGRDGAAHQTVVPPSIHPSGEPVEWHGDIIAPAVIGAAALRTASAWLAIGCLVARYVSPHAAERPGPDLPDLLAEADPGLGAAARRWLALPGRTARTATLRPRHELSPSDTELAELVEVIPNHADWDSWNAVGMALYAATGGSDHGAVLFDDWSAKSPKYNPYITADRWRHYRRSPPSRTGAGKLVALARQHGWRPGRAGAA
jgi:hypothetical protein